MAFDKLILSTLVASAFQCAGADNHGDKSSIIDIAKSAEGFSTLVAAIEASTAGPAGPNLVEALSGDGTFTIFAPTNAAFGKLPSELVSKLLDSTWQPQLQDVLLYHALGAEVLSTDLSEGLTTGTFNGEDITVNLNPPRINDNSNILIDDGLVDVEANNGVIHGVDSVLTPTSVTSNIVDLGVADENFSTLVAAVTAAGLVDALSGEGPFTLFAPTNDAFNALPEGTLDSLLEPENVDQLKDILLYHVVAANAHSAGLSSGSVETLNGASVDVAVSDGGVTVGDANVISPDVIASNGIIHVIDAVILPPTEEEGPADSIIDIAKSADDFSTLVAAIEASTVGPAGPNIADALSGEGTFTVFAPTNAAFDKLPSELVSKLLESTWQPQLQDVLLYHVLGSEVLSTDLSDGLSAATLESGDITVNLNPPRINENSNILIDAGLVDVEAGNGIIHGIDSVLTPTSVMSNIVDIAVANDAFSTLVAAVTAAGLGEALSGAGPLTVFAPTNEAFDALPEGTLDSLLEPENIDQLTDILKYHVVAANAHSSGLSTGPVETLNGAPVDVTVADTGVMVGDANVIKSDVIASNGIIHVIDAVILPPTEDAPAESAEAAPTEPESKTSADVSSVEPKEEETVEEVSPAVAATSYKALMWIVLFAVYYF